MAEYRHNAYLTGGALMGGSGVTWLLSHDHPSSEPFWDAHTIVAFIIIGIAVVLLVGVFLGRLPGLHGRGGSEGHGFILPENVQSVTMDFRGADATTASTVPPIAGAYAGGVPDEGLLPNATSQELAGLGPLRDREFRLVDIVYRDLVKGRTFERCVIRGPAIVYAPDAELVGCQFDYLHELESILWPLPSSNAAVGVILVQGCKFRECHFVGIGFTGPPDHVDQIRRALGASVTDHQTVTPAAKRGSRKRNG